MLSETLIVTMAFAYAPYPRLLGARITASQHKKMLQHFVRP